MKKVLSVLLAAAMVMGMTVSASAANFFGKGSTDAVNTTTVKNISWESVVIVKINTQKSIGKLRKIVKPRIIASFVTNIITKTYVIAFEII